MSLQLVAAIGWLVHLLASHFVFRHIRDGFTRTILTLSICVLLSYASCHGLAEYQMSSIAIVSLCWIISIRMVHLIGLSPSASLTFPSFIGKVFWTLFPLERTSATQKDWPLVCDLLLGCVKICVNDWIIRWIAHCGGGDSYATIVLYALMILTISYSFDLQIAVVRLVTRDKYRLLSWSNWPILSTSLREFWGVRYNRLTNAVLRESVFEPVRALVASSTIAALTTFAVSGLLHVHNVVVAFHDPRAIVPTFAFFFLHGLACSAERYLKIRLPAPLGWLVTFLFLIVTTPLVFGPFSRRGGAFFAANPPPLANVHWMPKLPLPNFCTR